MERSDISMQNEFGYIDSKKFEVCDTDKQIFSTISINDNGIEFKTNGTSGMSVFDTDKIPNAIYAVDSKLSAITALRIRILNSNFSAISSSLIQSDMYFIKLGLLGEGESIKHFTTKTKVRKICYYNDSLSKIFKNKSFEVQQTLKENVRKSFKVICLKKYNEKKIGEFVFLKQNKVEVFLKGDFKFNHQFTGCETIEIKDDSSIELRFKKGIMFKEAYEFILLLDSVIYLMTLMVRRHKNIIIRDFRKNSYVLSDKKKYSEDRKIKESNFLICDRKDTFKIFLNLLKNMYELNNEAKNAMFPFWEFDSKQTSLEIKLLEYYKTLEFIRYKENMKKGKGKNKTFLLEILNENEDIKNRFFGSQDNKEIEEEIRSLRNFYSHTGYYLNSLPIPTDKPQKYKQIDTKWLYDVLEFLKIETYLEFYKVCGINVDWKKIIYYI